MPGSLPTITFRGRPIEIDAPHLVFTTAIAGWCAWFCQDAWRAQRDVENLILIVPASIAAIACYATIAVGCFQEIMPNITRVAARRPLDRGLRVKIIGTMALLAAYATTGPLIGFDVATFAYLLAMLLFLGERRMKILLLAPLLVCALAIYCFSTVLATPLPLFLFGDAS